MEEQQEIWKPIIIEKNGILYDYTGLYEVSNMGRVRSLNYRRTGKEKIIKTGRNTSGYLYVGLSYDGKREIFTIHRLVANAFVPNPNNFTEVNHRDECKNNNYVDNLEWCDRKYNMNYGTRNERASHPQSNETRKKISISRTGKGTGKRSDMAGEKNPSARKVICIETEQVFGCIRDAEKWCGKKGVDKSCKGKAKTAGGYRWMYYEDWIKIQKDDKI